MGGARMLMDSGGGVDMTAGGTIPQQHGSSTWRPVDGSPD